jgi:hypothetical protein
MEIFAAMCTSVHTREWFERKLGKGCNVYMIVGFETLSDGVVEQKKSYSVSTGISAAIVATGTPLDLTVGTEISGGQVRKVCIHAIEEQVCTVQCRKVDFEWFRSRDLDKAALEKGHRWKFYWATPDKD